MTQGRRISNVNFQMVSLYNLASGRFRNTKSNHNYGVLFGILSYSKLLLYTRLYTTIATSNTILTLALEEAMIIQGWLKVWR